MIDVLFIRSRWVFPPIKILHFCMDGKGFCDRFAHFMDNSITISAIPAPADSDEHILIRTIEESERSGTSDCYVGSYEGIYPSKDFIFEHEYP